MADKIKISPVARAVPFDTSTGKGFNLPDAPDVQSALEHLRDHTIFDSRTQATTASGTLTLTNTDSNLQYLTGSATGYAVQLPSATTLSVAAYYQIINTTTQSVDIKDGSGTTLFSLSQNSIGYIYLQINSSTAGTWVWYQTQLNVASGIITYNVTTTTAFTTTSSTDVVITGFTVTPQAGTYGVWFNSTATCTQNNSSVLHSIYKGGSIVSDSTRTTQSVSSNFIFQQTTMTIIQVNGSQAVDVRVNTNQGSHTVNGRSLLLIRLGA